MALPDSIEIETIKGVLPNFITARAEIARLKAEEIAAAAAEGREPGETVFCQYCGRKLRSRQALNAHLSGCPGKRQVLTAATEGVRFSVGDRDLLIITRSIKLLAGLEGLEEKLGGMVADGTIDEESARAFFIATVRGAEFYAPAGQITMKPATSA